jgi:hypothetical protein
MLLTSRNPVIEIRRIYESANSSIVSFEILGSTAVPSIADLLNTFKIESRFSDKNLRPSLKVCSFCSPRLKTTAIITRMVASNSS